MKPFKIRDIEINPPLILSPMAGVTDYTFRRLIKRRGGVGLVVSEFISVEGLTRHNPKSKRQMRFDEEERPFAVQIFGGQPNEWRSARKWRRKSARTFSTLTAVARLRKSLNTAAVRRF
jgi:tRNA-dihydrouridine synthase B